MEVEGWGNGVGGEKEMTFLELLKHEQVYGVIGPQHLTEAIFVLEVGQKVHVPIITFTTRNSDIENHYFVRTTIDDVVQTRALAAICKGFQWAKVVILYEETDYDFLFTSHLNKALQDVEIGQVHLVAIPSSAKNNHLLKELSMLNKKQTGVFLVHMNPSLGFRLFTLAKKVGMMSEGYAWIITDSISNFLDSMDSVTRDSMERVVGIRPYIPHSENLVNLQERWIRNSMLQKKNRGQVMDVNAYGLWAYDTIIALAITVEKIGPVNSSLLELSSTKFIGLSGDFELVDGKLKPSAFEIFNIIGTRERRGWPILPARILRIGVPWKSGYREFVNVTDIDPTTNRTHNPTGLAIDIFNAALKLLSFSIKYEFYYYNGTNNDNWTYDDMLRGIPQGSDTTIWAPRTAHVDFSLPYTESGVVLVVKNKKAFDMWIFTKPLRWDLLLAIGLACIFMGIIIWILERPVTNKLISPSEESVVKPDIEQLGMTYLAPITVLAFPERKMSFTANLSAILTIDQLKFSFSEDYYLGYSEASVMKKFLTEKLNINESRLKV
ncbi:Glutamate receptor 2.7 [Sesamum alatum]|uniref:Glutamate receptor 2.7 n=1 Tax=Sesamum alatum TaxID=300844 RepID=A0AAE2CAN4_9LAMI|nr:Glutamate receptor 2.7 [Sesamum alatum]